MPLTWDDASEGASGQPGAPSHDRPIARVSAWPHRSLPRHGFAAFILITFCLLLLPLIPLLGTPVLWGLLPFLMGALALTWLLIQRSYRDGQLTEVLTIWPDRIELLRRNPRGPDQRWEANPYWVTVELHPEGGPVENYVTLTGDGRAVEFGAFLTPDERKALYYRLDALIRRQKG